MSHPALLRLLPRAIRGRIESFQRRRWHLELDPAKVVTIVHPQLVGVLLRHTPLYKAAEGWGFHSFDKAVGRRLLRERTRAAVHAFEGAALRTFRVAKGLGLPTILDVPSAHEYYIAALQAEGLEQPDPEATTERVRAERALSDYVLAPSPFVVRCLLDHGVAADKIVHLPYGADIETERPGVHPNGRFRALFVGSIGLRKGVRYLLDAWRQLALDDAELLLVGRCDDFGATLVTSLPAGCRWMGQVPRHEVHRWFDESDLFVFPSLAEGSALVTYEAMAAGLPIITTPNAGSVARDGDEGFIVPANDSAALAEKIRLMFERPDLRARMALSARRLIETTYTWRHYRARLGVAYRAILDDRSPQDALAMVQFGVPPLSSQAKLTGSADVLAL
jgi:glycosyltransferase involved in cell wall biosynthesis